MIIFIKVSKSKMTVNKDDDTYSYSFKLDGKDIEANRASRRRRT